MAIRKDCEMLEVEINSIRWNLSDLCSVALLGLLFLDYHLDLVVKTKPK